MPTATSAVSRNRRSPVAVPKPAAPPMSFAEQVCLVLVSQGVSHGWALGSLLGPDGDIGRIWNLSRPLTYRAVDQLVDRGLVTRRADVSGPGRERALLAVGAAGRRLVAAWLDAPVEHLRDVRTELLVKLTLRRRAGLDNADLVGRQKTVFDGAIDALTRRAPTGDPVDVWRREHARAVRRFLDQAVEAPAPGALARPEMRLSARNQLRGSVQDVKRGELMASVRAVLADGQSLTATITQEAVDDLDIAPGDEVIMVVKATEVMVAKAR